MTIYFITGNKEKFSEAKNIIPELKQLDIDLPEIQETDAKEIIKEKLKEATNHKQAEFIVEDTSLCLNALNGLLGPLIKWFLKKLGNEGIYEIVSKTGDNIAEAKTIIGYSNQKKIYFFEGRVKGKIVKPKNDNGFGWDPIFIPEGKNKRFSEMSKEDKNNISMRSKAFKKLKKFLKH